MVREFSFGDDNAVMRGNRDAVGSAYATALSLLDLHQQGIVALSAEESTETSKYNLIACRLVATHGLNLAAAAFNLSVYGQFDVVPYLLRGLFDAHGLFFGCAVNDRIARSFLDGRSDVAAKARIASVNWLRVQGDETAAEMLDKMYKMDRAEVNGMAHLGAGHLRRMLDGRVPTVGGHVDAQKARASWAVALGQERQLVRRLELFAAVGEEWRGQFSKTVDEINAYSNAVKMVKS